MNIVLMCNGLYQFSTSSNLWRWRPHISEFLSIHFSVNLASPKCYLIRRNILNVSPSSIHHTFKGENAIIQFFYHFCPFSWILYSVITLSMLKFSVNWITRFQNITDLYNKPICHKILSLVQTFSGSMIEKVKPTANEDKLFPNCQTSLIFSIKFKFLSE